MPDVVRVLDALPAPDEPMPVFADRVLHDTKALTDGGLRGILLRALAVWRGRAYRSAANRNAPCGSPSAWSRTTWPARCSCSTCRPAGDWSVRG